MHQRFMNGYCAAIRFTEEMDSEPFSQELIDQIDLDCANFFAQNKHFFPRDQWEQAGIDFWLTRNGHGAGYWDKTATYGEVNAQILTARAHSYNEFYVYIGDDGLVYGM